ncbi:MAG: hypothetical protein IJ375_01500 [Oscillospiraceae bacterium]|nr:hypothetical protein [Oscillospiraceae bacterium]
MSKDKKSIFDAKLDMSGGTHATLVAVIGAYLVYMAYQMVRDTLSGASTMSMTTTVILAGLMALAGLGVMGYALWSWLRGRKAGKEEERTDEA